MCDALPIESKWFRLMIVFFQFVGYIASYLMLLTIYNITQITRITHRLPSFELGSNNVVIWVIW